ncbi:MAG: hypothetical protein HGB01_05125 [Chlorobiaceae bacterium]|nr:hypothetical protein [Chlorobiales bacterium]NTU90809.1 hypothetical protein [Chlorobiaceae bacterium]NTV25573.1 hypothetical protein [Chlorobiaceae bacterium]
MKKQILERYDRLADGRVIIDVSASRVEELYEDFDKTAPYHKKDLDEDLALYLTACLREIGNADFVIRFTFDVLPAGESRERVRTSLHKFFMYRRELEMDDLNTMLRTSLLYFVSGMVLLSCSLWAASVWPDRATSPFIGRVVVEGLTIAAWVSLWEAVATFMINWPPRRQRISLNERIADASVMFQGNGVHERPMEFSGTL